MRTRLRRKSRYVPEDTEFLKEQRGIIMQVKAGKSVFDIINEMKKYPWKITKVTTFPNNSAEYHENFQL